MTPAEHKTEAESLLALVGAANHLGPSDADFAVIAAHAALAKAAGTGDHYTAAEAALTQAASAKNVMGGRVGYIDAARTAHAYAQLADT